jgi:hypothetical protein
MERKFSNGLLLIFALLAISTVAFAGRIIYIDDDSAGANNGSSWVDAYRCLQDALTVAQYDDEIWVAKGVYKPDQRAVVSRFGYQIRSSGVRAETFQLKNGVSVKGGYAGLGGPDPNERDFEMYKTILSGDLSGNDVDVNDPCDLLTESTRADNSYHVVTGSGVYETTVLDGFTITGGNANDQGGGMSTREGSPTLTNCNLTSNSAKDDGGGMFNNKSCPRLINCTFTGNSAGDSGGGIRNKAWSSATFINCTFIGNSAGRNGGGMDNSDTDAVNSGSNVQLNNCVFAANSAMFGGGMSNCRSNPSLTNCRFSGNLAQNGKALACESSMGYVSNIKVANCIFWDGGNEISNADGSAIGINYSDIQAGQAGVYDPCESIVWGEGNINADPCFAQPGFWGPNGTPDDPNDDFWVDGDYHLKSQASRWDPKTQAWVMDDVTSPCIDAGDPNSPISHEPFPNGGRINMGAYGGTAESSKSYFGKLPCETIIAGDINGDCRVDFKDFTLMASHWLEGE